MDNKEIAKRLEIVKLAVEINDNDVVALQAVNLNSTNRQELVEIATLLNKGNYKQALYLIKKYLENSNIDFDLEDGQKILNIEDMLKMSPIAKETIREFKRSGYSKEDLEAFAKNIQVPPMQEYDKVDVDEYIQENVLQNSDKNLNEESNVNKDLQPSTQPTNTQEEEISKSEDSFKDIDSNTPLDEISKEVLKDDSKKKRTKVLSSYKTLRAKFGKKDKKEKVEEKKIESPKENRVKTEEEQTATENIYPPIAHLTEKYREYFVLYPPVKESEIWLEDIALTINKLSNNSYTDKDIEKIYKEYEYYLNLGELAKAAQFLLLLAATDSTYARFILARELFKGKVLKRDIQKSYALMVELAKKGYPNAICDLGQFYEYGIIVNEDKKRALKLYEKAFELGVNRATKHINRIKENSNIFTKLFGK